jgi:hypothetical protein
LKCCWGVVGSLETERELEEVVECEEDRKRYSGDFDLSGSVSETMSVEVVQSEIPGQGKTGEETLRTSDGREIERSGEGDLKWALASPAFQSDLDVRDPESWAWEGEREPIKGPERDRGQKTWKRREKPKMGNGEREPKKMVLCARRVEKQGRGEEGQRTAGERGGEAS